MENFKWYWIDSDDVEHELNSKDSQKIEYEYKNYLLGTRCGLLTHHCFGDKSSAVIDFESMKTSCGSGRCMIKHNSIGGLKENHMEFKLRRTI